MLLNKIETIKGVETTKQYERVWVEYETPFSAVLKCMWNG